MKVLKWILIVIGLFLGIGFLLPGVTHMERSMTYKAPADSVFIQVNELRNWQAWSPWAKLDPNIVWNYSNPSSGLGAYYTWQSQNAQVGNGKLTIIDLEPSKKIKYRLEFEGAAPSTAEFRTVAKDSTTTEVTWTLDSEYGLNPIDRWFGLLLEKFVGPDYEKGLNNLKPIVEKQ